MKHHLYYLLLFLPFSANSQSSIIELHSHVSTILGQTKYYNIFLPKDYSSSNERYPVLYLFRGHEREWANDGEDGSRRGNIKTVFDSLYAKGNLQGMILVMPGLNAPPTQNDYLYVTQELIPYIDATYRTIRSRWLRGIDGFSLGGLTTLNLMATVPQFFSSIGSYDGTFSMFNKNLLSAPDPALLRTMRSLRILFHSASPDGPSNYNNNVQILSMLKDLGIDNSFDPLLLQSGAQHNWYYADKHMSLSMPLHFQKFFSNEQINISTSLQFTTPAVKYSGTVDVEWNSISLTDSVTHYLYHSHDDGKTWSQIYYSGKSTTTYTLNTLPLQDGTLHRLRLISAGDTLYGKTITERFTIDNPGNALPDVLFLQPYSGAVITDSTVAISWYANDADDEPLTISLFISYDDGKHWDMVVQEIPNSGNYTVSSSKLSNSNSVAMKVIASDGHSNGSAIITNVTLNVPRTPITTIPFNHLHGSSTALLSIAVSDASKLTGHPYEIRFQKAEASSYSIRDVATDLSLFDSIPLYTINTESPEFDGLRLSIQNVLQPAVNTDSLRWVQASTPLKGTVNLLDINTGESVITAVPLPYDYEFRMSNSISDTSLAAFGVPAVTTYFTIVNTTLGTNPEFIYLDYDNNQTISDLDEIYLFEKIKTDSSLLTWHLFFSGNSGVLPPSVTDIFRLTTFKPLHDDIYTIDTRTLHTLAEHYFPANFHVEQAFPNPFNPATNIRFSVPSREQTVVRIYDVLGREIETLLNKSITPGVHTIAWMAKDIPSGIYFARVQHDTYTDTKKLLLIK